MTTVAVSLAILLIISLGFNISQCRKLEACIEHNKNIVTITDKLPERRDAQSYALKLSNELKDYFIVNEETNTLSLRVQK